MLLLGLSKFIKEKNKMADFCTDCAIKMGLSKPDINVNEIFKNLKTEEYESCLCEGCGLKAIVKNKDNKLILIKNSRLILSDNKALS